MNSIVRIYSESDYGYYGRTGKFKAKKLPTSKCLCKVRPKLECEYDDTPGMRDTFFTLFCPKCKKEVGGTDLDNVIDKWNIVAKRDHVCTGSSIISHLHLNDHKIGLKKNKCEICKREKISVMYYSLNVFDKREKLK